VKKLEVRYKECYEKMAKDNSIDHLEPDRAVRYEKMKRFIGDVQNEKVLDVGCGDGQFLNILACEDKYGLDISSFNIEIAKQHKDIILIQGDAESLPYADKFFDVVICADVLEHVLKPEKVVEEIRRVLKDDGKLFIVVPWEEDISIYEMYNGVYEFTHMRRFDVETFGELFKDFSIKRSKGIYGKWIRVSQNKNIFIKAIHFGINKVIFKDMLRCNIYPGPVHKIFELRKGEK
jgi:ubiquinone/menaquinone biosynthesis C-methylase UbiE